MLGLFIWYLGIWLGNQMTVTQQDQSERPDHERGRSVEAEPRRAFAETKELAESVRRERGLWFETRLITAPSAGSCRRTRRGSFRSR